MCFANKKLKKKKTYLQSLPWDKIYSTTASSTSHAPRYLSVNQTFSTKYAKCTGEHTIRELLLTPTPLSLNIRDHYQIG